MLGQQSTVEIEASRRMDNEGTPRKGALIWRLDWVPVASQPGGGEKELSVTSARSEARQTQVCRPPAEGLPAARLLHQRWVYS